jgi:hypothetical protein
VESLREGAVYWNAALHINMRDDDEDDGEKAKAIHLRDEPIARDDATQRKSREKVLHRRLSGFGHVFLAKNQYP